MTELLPNPKLTGNPKWDQPCAHWLGSEKRFCGAMPTKAYLNPGRGCINHTPARLKGHPEPGRAATMPAWFNKPAPPMSAMQKVEDKHILSGKRRSSAHTQAEVRARRDSIADAKATAAKAAAEARR